MCVYEKYKNLLQVEDRAANGEVSTPKSLVNEILDRFPEEVFTSKVTTFLDPAFGNGTFLVEIVKRLRKCGHSMENIQERIYGTEISHRLYNKVTKLFSNYNFHNLYKEDFLIRDFKSMKFDVIVMNPPYNEAVQDRLFYGETNFRGGSTVLAKKFTSHCLTLCKGYMGVVQPYTHRTYSTKVQRDYKDKGLYLVTECNHFPQVTQEIGVFYFNVNSKVEEVNDEFLKVPKALNPLSVDYTTVPGPLRSNVEHLLSNTGKYRFIITPANIKYTDDESFIGPSNDKSYGNWRVVLPWVATKTGIGRIYLAEPSDTLSHSTGCFIVKDKNTGEKLIEYLKSDEFIEIIKQVKTTVTNAKKWFEFVEKPDFLL